MPWGTILPSMLRLLEWVASKYWLYSHALVLREDVDCGAGGVVFCFVIQRRGGPNITLDGLGSYFTDTFYGSVFLAEHRIT